MQATSPHDTSPPPGEPSAAQPHPQPAPPDAFPFATPTLGIAPPSLNNTTTTTTATPPPGAAADGSPAATGGTEEQGKGNPSTPPPPPPPPALHPPAAGGDPGGRLGFFRGSFKKTRRGGASAHASQVAPREGRIDLNVRRALEAVGRRCGADNPRDFALDVLDRCIDPDGVYARVAEGEDPGACEPDRSLESRRRLDAVRASLRSENRQDSSDRVGALQTKLTTLGDESRSLFVATLPFTSPQETRELLTCSATAAPLHRSTLLNVTTLLSRLYRPGGVTTPASLTAIASLGIPVHRPDPLSPAAWQATARVIRTGKSTSDRQGVCKTASSNIMSDVGAVVVSHRLHHPGGVGSGAQEAPSRAGGDAFHRRKSATDILTRLNAAGGGLGGGGGGGIGGAIPPAIPSRDSPRLQHSLNLYLHLRPAGFPPAGPRGFFAAPPPPQWAQWVLRSSEGVGPTSTSTSASSTTSTPDAQFASLLLSHRPSAKCVVTSEAAVSAALLRCIGGGESALFRRGAGHAWAMHPPLGEELTIPGWSWGALREAAAPVLRTASLCSAITAACHEGSRQAAGPTLPLFASLLLRRLCGWQAEAAAAASPTPPSLISLPRRLRAMEERLEVVARLMHSTANSAPAFPVGSVLLQSIYRELRREVGMSCGGVAPSQASRSSTLLLELLNASLKPLLSALSNLMHGESPGVWLEEVRKSDASAGNLLLWETLPLPAFLSPLQGGIAEAGRTVRDIRVVHPQHPVFQQAAAAAPRAPMDSHEWRGHTARRGSRGTAGGSQPISGLLGAALRSGDRVESLPIGRGVRLTVGGAVGSAEAIASVVAARAALAGSMARRAEMRAAEEARRAAELREEAVRRSVPTIPESWPGSFRYKRDAAERAELLRQGKQAEQKRFLDEQVAAQAALRGSEAVREAEEERARLSPRFTDAEMEGARDAVLKEYAAKSDAVDARMAEVRSQMGQPGGGDANTAAASTAESEGGGVGQGGGDDITNPSTNPGTATTHAGGVEEPAGGVEGVEEEEEGALKKHPASGTPDAAGGAAAEGGRDKAAPTDADTATTTTTTTSAAAPTADPDTLVGSSKAQSPEGATLASAAPPLLGRSRRGGRRAGGAGAVGGGVAEGASPPAGDVLAISPPRRRRVRGAPLGGRGPKDLLEVPPVLKRRARGGGRTQKQPCRPVLPGFFPGGTDTTVLADGTRIPPQRQLLAEVDDTGVSYVPVAAAGDPYAETRRRKEEAARQPPPPPPKDIVSPLASVQSALYTRRKAGCVEESASFDCLQRIKNLNTRIRAGRGGGGGGGVAGATQAPEAATPAWLQPGGVPHSASSLRTLAQQWTGRKGVLPEKLPLMLRGEALPLDLALDCTVGRAVQAQKRAVDEAIQEVTLEKARLVDSMAVLHAMYLAYDSFVSSEVAGIIDQAAARKILPVNAKGRIQLALLKLRTPHTPADTRDLVANFGVVVHTEIGVRSGGPAARAGRSEHAEDYVELTYRTPKPLRHIITEEHHSVYQRVHRLLLALQSAVRVSTGVLRECSRNRVRASSPSTVGLSVLRFQVQRVLQSTLTYLCDGLRAATQRYHAVLCDVHHPQHPTNALGYHSMHSAFTTGLERFTMLSISVKPQYRRLRELVRIALELPCIARAPQPSPSAVQSLTKQFESARKYILDSLVAMMHAPDTAQLTEPASSVVAWPSQSQWAQELLARIDPSSIESR